MQADGRSLSTYKACLFLWKGEFFMEIQMNIDAECLNLILEHNLIEKLHSCIGLGEVLDWITEHPEVLERDKPSFLYTGEEGVSVVLKMERQGDVLCVTVDQVMPY